MPEPRESEQTISRVVSRARLIYATLVTSVEDVITRTFLRYASWLHKRWQGPNNVGFVNGFDVPLVLPCPKFTWTTKRELPHGQYKGTYISIAINSKSIIAKIKKS